MQMPLSFCFFQEVRSALVSASMHSAGRHVRVVACCPLPAGTHISASKLMSTPAPTADASCSAAAVDLSRLMQDLGPEALLHLHTTAQTPDTCANVTDGAASAADASAGSCVLPPSAYVSHELMLSPAPGDPQEGLKMQLLVASGIGPVHMLTPGLEGMRLITAALKLCLLPPGAPGSRGSEELPLMQEPAVQRLLRAHARVKSGGGGGGGADAGAGAGGSSGAEAVQQLHDAQAALLAWLEGLPRDHPVCKATR